MEINIEQLAEGLRIPKRTTISEIYGLTEKEHDEMVGDLLKDMYVMDNKSDVINKHFADIKDAKLRCKVHAYAVAFKVVQNK